MSHNCDFSPIKAEIKEHLHNMADRLRSTVDRLDQEEHCLLCEFAQFRKELSIIESMAASFYLKCYLNSRN